MRNRSVSGRMSRLAVRMMAGMSCRLRGIRYVAEVVIFEVITLTIEAPRRLSVIEN